MYWNIYRGRLQLQWKTLGKQLFNMACQHSGVCTYHSVWRFCITHPHVTIGGLTLEKKKCLTHVSQTITLTCFSFANNWASFPASCFSWWAICSRSCVIRTSWSAVPGSLSRTGPEFLEICRNLKNTFYRKYQLLLFILWLYKWLHMRKIKIKFTYQFTVNEIVTYTPLAATHIHFWGFICSTFGKMKKLHSFIAAQFIYNF